MTFEDFREVIAEIAHVSLDKIQETSSFRDDLGVDSLQFVNLIMEISQRFGVELSAIRHSDDIATVGNMYRTFFGEEST
ncbi:acyl carrier protein [Bacillaceae bacterium]